MQNIMNNIDKICYLELTIIIDVIIHTLLLV